MGVTGEAHTSLGLAALMTAGGAMGYAKRRSVPSLVAGAAFGTGFAISGWLIAENDARMGHLLGLGLSSGLSVGMGYRAIRSRGAPVPTAVAGLGIASGVYYALKAREWS